MSVRGVIEDGLMSCNSWQGLKQIPLTRPPVASWKSCTSFSVPVVRAALRRPVTMFRMHCFNFLVYSSTGRNDTKHCRFNLCIFDVLHFLLLFLFCILHRHHYHDRWSSVHLNHAFASQTPLDPPGLHPAFGAFIFDMALLAGCIGIWFLRAGILHDAWRFNSPKVALAQLHMGYL